MKTKKLLALILAIALFVCALPLVYAAASDAATEEDTDIGVDVEDLPEVDVTVIYGDANGDGIIDVIDTILLDLQQAGDGDIANNSAAWHALNVGGNDKVIDSKDVIKLDAYANFEGELDQSAIVI